MSTSPQAEFIGGWAETVDEVSGRTYYYNQLNQTTWEKPKERREAEKMLKFKSKSDRVAPSPSRDPKEIPPSISSKGTPLSHDKLADIAKKGPEIPAKPHNLHSATKFALEAKLKPISAKPTRSESQGKASPKEEWVKLLDSASGRYYYANMKTGVTRWDLPSGMEIIESTSESQSMRKGLRNSAHSAVIPRTGKDRNGNIYDELYDSERGKFYYFNRNINITSWEKPESFTYIESNQSNSRDHSENPKVPFAPNAAMGTKLTHSRSSGANLRQRKSTNSRSTATVKDATDGLPDTLKAEIHCFQLENHAREYFRTAKVRNGLFKRTIPVEELLQFSTEPLSGPLVKSATNDHSAAAVSFKTICKFIGVIESKKTPTKLAKIIVDLGIEKAALRDEIFCQIVKQSTRNPKLNSVALCWRLFILCSCSFPPTRGMESFLFNFMSRQSNSVTTTEIHTLILFAIYRLSRTIRSGPMKTPLTLNEVSDIKEKLNPLMISFGSSLGFILKCQTDHYSEIPELLRMLIRFCKDHGGHQTEGIFRRTGDKVDIERLINLFDHGHDDPKELGISDPLVFADVIKIWLRELNPRIFSPEFSSKALTLADRGPEACWGLFSQRSLILESHYNTMMELLEFCILIVKNHSQTSMTADNLGIVLAPNLFTEEGMDPGLLFQYSNAKNIFVSNLIKAKLNQ